MWNKDSTTLTNTSKSEKSENMHYLIHWFNAEWLPYSRNNPRRLKAKNSDLEDLFKEEKGGTELFIDEHR